MNAQKFVTYTTLGLASALAVGCTNAPTPDQLSNVDGLTDQQTAEVLTVRDGGSSSDFADWSPEQEIALDTLGAGYFSTRKH